MQKAIELAKDIVKNPKGNYINDLDDIKLYKVFEQLYEAAYTTQTENKLIAFIIFAFDPDSQKLDVRKDRYENKCSIMENLGLSITDDLIQQILSNSNEVFNNTVLLYLEELTNWRWPTIYSLLDYHSNMIRFATQKTDAEKSFDKMNKEGEVKTITQDYDIDTIAKVNIQKSDIFKRAIDARKQADELLDDIRKEFMPTDHAVQTDFGFTFTDTAKKKVDILSWRAFIKELNDKKLGS